jgi:6-phosphofructokinase 2
VPRIVTLTMNPALDIATATEVVRPTHKLRCEEPRYDPGGGGINVARAAHRLGGDALAVFPVGGLSGERLCQLLQTEGVPHDTIPIGGSTRESFAIVEQATGEQYRFVLPGPCLSGAEQEKCIEKLAALLRDASYLVASGSLPKGVPNGFYRRIGDLAQRHAIPFVLDTSGPALTGAGDGIFLLKTSLTELEQLAGAPLPEAADQERAARNIIADGRAQNLVLSLGASGALLATENGVRRFAAIPVDAVGSVGAGDSMLGGIVSRLASGQALGDAVQFGMAAGAAAMLRAGTGLCDRDDTERLYRSAANMQCRVRGIP